MSDENGTTESVENNSETLLDSSPTEETPKAEEGKTLLDGQESTKEEEKAETAPEEYAEFTMPEGVELNSDILAEASPLFKELGLSQENAQKLVDFHANQVQAITQSQDDAYNQLMNEWTTETTAEFGDNLQETVAYAQAAIEKFGSPEVKQLFSDHGLGNHKEVIRFLSQVGRLTKEDVPGEGSPGAEQTLSKDEERLKAFYG